MNQWSNVLWVIVLLLAIACMLVYLGAITVN